MKHYLSGMVIALSLALVLVLGVVALVYLLPVILFLMGYFLSEGIAENIRYAIAIGAAALSMIPIVLYDRHAKRTDALTYTILRLF